MSDDIEDVIEHARLVGVRITNEAGMPPVEVTRAIIARGYQSFDVKTAKQMFTFYVTPKGYLRVQAVRKLRG